MTILLIIPCFNEEDSIRQVLVEAASVLPEADLLVVNDASSDNTSEAARQSGKAVVIDLLVNLGVGGAVQTGFKYALQKGFDFAVKLDGDGQHDPADVEKLLKPLKEGVSDIVIGSRFVTETAGFQSTAVRRLGISIISGTCLMLTGKKISDPTSGLRAYNKRAIAFMAGHYPSFDYPEPEEIILACKNGLNIMEVPANMRTRLAGQSSISSAVSVYYMVKVILAMLFINIRRPEILQELQK